jgi:hypothetical protein
MSIEQGTCLKDIQRYRRKKVNNFNMLRMTLMSASFFAITTTSSLAESVEKGLFDVDGWKVAKTVCSGTYDHLLRDQYLKAAEPIKALAATKLKQLLWRAGDLAALQNDGTFIPVVHQYKNLGDWALSFVLGAKARNVIHYGSKAANWMYDLESQLDKALRDKYGVSTLEEFTALAAGKVSKKLVLSAYEYAAAPSHALSVSQIRDLKADLSTQADREQQLRGSYEEWTIQDWVDHIMFNFNTKMNEQADFIFGYIQDSLKDAFVNAELAVWKKGITATGTCLAGMVTSNPWAAMGAGYALNQATPTFPKAVLERHKNSLETALNTIADERGALFSVTADEIRKHHNEVITTTTDVELDLEVIEKKEVGTPSLSHYLKNLASNAVSSSANATVAAVNGGANFLKDAYQEGSNKRQGKKLGTTYKKRDAALAGAANATVAAVSGGANLLKAGAGKVFGWFR